MYDLFARVPHTLDELRSAMCEVSLLIFTYVRVLSRIAASYSLAFDNRFHQALPVLL